MLDISLRVRKKLAEKHNVSEREVMECFANRDGKLLLDTREEHRSDPPTQWFVAETNMGRVLKVMFVYNSDNQTVHLKSAYEPSEQVIEMYNRKGYSD